VAHSKDIHVARRFYYKSLQSLAAFRAFAKFTKFKGEAACTQGAQFFNFYLNNLNRFYIYYYNFKF
jgi:hypothetical protein